jgi:hypothetical protein
MIIVNMYIAVILDNLHRIIKDEDENNQAALHAAHFEAFYTAWQRFDPKASQFIRMSQLKNFVCQIPPPLGYYPHGRFPRSFLLRPDLLFNPPAGLHFQKIHRKIQAELSAETRLGNRRQPLSPPHSHTIQVAASTTNHCWRKASVWQLTNLS